MEPNATMLKTRSFISREGHKPSQLPQSPLGGRRSTVIHFSSVRYSSPPLWDRLVFELCVCSCKSCSSPPGLTGTFEELSSNSSEALTAVISLPFIASLLSERSYRLSVRERWKPKCGLSTKAFCFFCYCYKLCSSKVSAFSPEFNVKNIRP